MQAAGCTVHDEDMIVDMNGRCMYQGSLRMVGVCVCRDASAAVLQASSLLAGIC
jgi:hypothetical protein